MPIEFTIPAEGELGVQMFYSKVPFSEDRFAETLEIRPGNRAVVHHAGVFVVDIPEGASIDAHGRLITPTASRPPIAAKALAGPRRHTRRCPARTSCCRGCPAAASTRTAPTSASGFPPASTSTGRCTTTRSAKPQTDRTRLGIWFNKVPVTHELLIRQAGDPLATTKGGLSLYRAEGKEVEYTADEGSTRRRSKTPNIPPYAENW